MEMLTTQTVHPRAVLEHSALVLDFEALKDIEKFALGIQVDKISNFINLAASRSIWNVTYPLYILSVSPLPLSPFPYLHILIKHY